MCLAAYHIMIVSFSTSAIAGVRLRAAEPR
jgi:hypothetical protein